jgi:lipoprotein-releasing system ATP-binding protein
MLTVEHVAKTFHDDAGELQVLKDVCFSIGRGEMVSLVGVSGAGKTTLLQILGGLDVASSGVVAVEGTSLDKMSSRQLAAFRSRFIGFVFQFHHLMPDFTALENVFMPGLILGRSRQQCTPRARELLVAVGLERRMSHYPNELSGGERQRVALARALFNQPALVLADEPTGSLDRKNGEMLLELFEKANREFNQTFLVATHNPQLCAGLKRTLYVEDGVVVERSRG